MFMEDGPFSQILTNSWLNLWIPNPQVQRVERSSVPTHLAPLPLMGPTREHGFHLMERDT